MTGVLLVPVRRRNGIGYTVRVRALENKQQVERIRARRLADARAAHAALFQVLDSPAFARRWVEVSPRESWQSVFHRTYPHGVAAFIAALGARFSR